MRICHLITRMILGGAQENTLLTVRGLLRRGHEVTLATGPSPGPEGKLLAKAELPGLNVVTEPALIRNLHPLSDGLALHRLEKFFRKEQFEVVHTHSSKAGILGRIAAARAGVPLIFHTVHGNAFHNYQSQWRNKLYIMAEKIAARHSHHIFAVSQAMIDQCVQAGIAARKKYSVVYSGMDLDPYLKIEPDTELRQELRIPPEAPVIGKIARLFELKGHKYLLEAAERIVREIPNARFLLVGDGKLRPSIEAEVKDRGLQDNFIFTGLVPPAEIPRYISLMNVLVHLSLREGLPRTVVQALAGGVPAVAYHLDGTPEVIIHGKTGYLCPPQSVREVSNSLLSLLRAPDKAKQMGAAGRDLVQQKFDYHSMVAQLENAYLTIAPNI